MKAKTVLILLLISSFAPARAQKFVSLDVLRASSIGHKSFEYGDAAALQYGTGISFQVQSDRIRYSTSIRWEHITVEPNPNSTLYREADYWGGEVELGIYNPYKNKLRQFVYGVSITGRSGKARYSSIGCFSCIVREPYIASQLVLGPQIGFAAQWKYGFRSELVLRNSIGYQIQDYGEEHETWVYGAPMARLTLVKQLPLRGISF
jgi:hypothetical protein